MNKNPRDRRPSNAKGWPKCWSLSKAEAKALLETETWSPDPENTNWSDEQAYVSDRGELLFLFKRGRSLLYASRQELMSRQAEFSQKPQSTHVLEGLLRQGPHFIEAVPALIDELAMILKIPRESLDGSFDSLAFVEEASAKIRPRKKILEVPNLFAGIVAYTGEVFRRMTGGHWHLHEVPGGIWEPYVHVDDSRYLNPFIEPYKDIIEMRRGGLMLRPLVSASLRVL